MFSDIDYSDYLSDSSPSSMQSFKTAKEYFSILLSQPFFVAKTVLQVKSQAVTDDGSISLQDVEDMRRPPSSYRDSLYSDVWTQEQQPQVLS